MGWMLDGYLDRLGVEWSGAPDLAGLRTLHRRHLESVPFENLSVHLGEPIVLDEVELVAKVVVRRRGGFCYELNGAFAWLLRSLGYQVELLQAGVFRPDGLPGPAFDHLALRVGFDEAAWEAASGSAAASGWLVDVGFGDNHCLPLPFVVGVDHHDPNGVFRLVAHAGDEDSLELWRDGKPQYRLGLSPHPLSSFEGMCRFHQSSPESHFTQNTICSLPTPEGRVTVRDRTLIVTRDGSRVEREVGDDELLACYRDRFGINLSRLPPVPGFV